MRVLLVLGLVLQTSSALACRIVCSKGDSLFHMLADGETDKFQLLRDTETLNSGLTCHLLPASGTDAEQEEQRLVNLCTGPVDKEGKRVVFRTERVQSRRVRLESMKPVEEALDELVWTWEEHQDDPATGKSTVKIIRRVEMDRKDCGSAEDR